MAIISKVEASTTKGRLVSAAIVTALTIGAMTMIYPFVLMVSGSLRSEMDETDLDFLPRYLVDRDVLFQKFAETKYNQDIQAFNRAHLRQDFNFRSASVPRNVNGRRVEDFLVFLEEAGMPKHWKRLGGIFGVRTVPENLRELRLRLAERYDGDVDALGRDAGIIVPGFQTIVLASPRWEAQRYDFDDNVLFEEYFRLEEEAPAAEYDFVSLTGYFLETMIYPSYGQVDTSRFNEAHPRTRLSHYREFVLPRTVPPEGTQLREEWIEFVHEELHPSFVLLEGVPEADFHVYLRENYGTIQELNYAWGVSYDAIEEISLPSGQWLRGAYRTDYLDFLQDLPPEHYRLTGPEYVWRDWLRERYGTVEEMNAAHGTAYPNIDQARMPVDLFEYAYVQENPLKLRATYAVRNYINVIDSLFLRGRAFLNTVIFCALSVGFSLLVNPLTAYALSRFQLPGTYKILLLLMATMAFPPMVTLIPTFIILQNLNLMNTFAALVLPTIANGYLIFLLKGFFDSLPRELYESAMIDGASEIRIFFQITMALSKPILAVVALMAFNGAYTMFLYPLLVAPREDMWLLSVWLYQYQLAASMGGVFASVLIASVPTIVIFIFAQNIIMRGIVIPVEK